MIIERVIMLIALMAVWSALTAIIGYAAGYVRAKNVWCNAHDTVVPNVSRTEKINGTIRQNAGPPPPGNGKKPFGQGKTVRKRKPIRVMVDGKFVTEL